MHLRILLISLPLLACALPLHAQQKQKQLEQQTKSKPAAPKPKTAPAPAREPEAYAFLLVTTDLDVNISVNFGKSYRVLPTDEGRRIPLEAGDNRIKVTPVDGGNDDYTESVFIDKRGNKLLEVKLKSKRDMDRLARERQGEFDYSLANVKSRIIWGEAPDKGIEYTLLPKGAPEGMAYGVLRIQFGDEKSMWGHKGLEIDLLADMLSDPFDYKNRNSRLYQEVEQLKGEILFGGSTGSMVVIFQAENNNIEKIIHIIAEILRYPDLNDYTFQEVKNERIAKLEEQRRKNYFIYNYQIEWTFCPQTFVKEHPHYLLNTEEELEILKGITLNDLKKDLKDFIGMDDAYFTLVGEFDTETITPLIIKEFSNWKTLYPFKEIPFKQGCACSPRDTIIAMPNAENFRYYLYFPMNVLENSDDDISIGITAEIMENRLKQRNDFAEMENPYSWAACGIYFGFSSSKYNPDNTRRLKSAILQEIQQIKKYGPSPEELDLILRDAKNRRTSKYNLSDENWRRYLSGPYKNGETLDKDLTWGKKHDAVTPDMIKSVLNKYNKAENIYLIGRGKCD